MGVSPARVFPRKPEAAPAAHGDATPAGAGAAGPGHPRGPLTRTLLSTDPQTAVQQGPQEEQEVLEEAGPFRVA